MIHMLDSSVRMFHQATFWNLTASSVWNYHTWNSTIDNTIRRDECEKHNIAADPKCFLIKEADRTV